MATKNNTPTESNPELVMIIAEERNTFRTLFNNFIDENGVTYIPTYEFQIMNLRSRFNPDLKYYKVNCETYKRYGYTADELFEEIYEKYIASEYEPLNELFTFFYFYRKDIRYEIY